MSSSLKCHDQSDCQQSCRFWGAGARVAWGGKPLEGHSIPEVYGAIQPTAVFVPLDQIIASNANWELVNTELFGPFQVTGIQNDKT